MPVPIPEHTPRAVSLDPWPDYAGDSDSADDEATLEEEEAEEAAEQGAAAAREAELEGLADDADLDLDQLLARYGYLRPGAEAADEGEPSPEASPPGAVMKEEAEPQRRGDRARADEPTAAPDAGKALRDRGPAPVQAPAQALTAPPLQNGVAVKLEQRPESRTRESSTPSAGASGPPADSMSDALAAMQEVQPKGHTLSTATVVAKVMVSGIGGVGLVECADTCTCARVAGRGGRLECISRWRGRAQRWHDGHGWVPAEHSGTRLNMQPPASLATTPRAAAAVPAQGPAARVPANRARLAGHPVPETPQRCGRHVLACIRPWPPAVQGLQQGGVQLAAPPSMSGPLRRLEASA